MKINFQLTPFRNSSSYITTINLFKGSGGVAYILHYKCSGHAVAVQKSGLFQLKILINCASLNLFQIFPIIFYQFYNKAQCKVIFDEYLY
ncbi:hypothetical protein AYI70_g3387 [Smittium culicis]|uniref:Uncharacterized protein n=1 Tax=Smittium culicis TaxID=133412 RepID=A0A1R1Y3P3_9FUNG|nr:hypothetical protein AYI70_g3387 [Smittium culicis]